MTEHEDIRGTESPELTERSEHIEHAEHAEHAEHTEGAGNIGDVQGDGLPGPHSPELRASYALCEAETERVLPPMGRATGLLPEAVRPHMHALHAFLVRTDDIADRDGTRAERVERLARWCRETLAELDAGSSTHPLRRAFVDTVRRMGLDRAAIEEFLDTISADCAHPPAFETFAEQRRYLRGIAGTIVGMWAPLLGARGPEASEAFSVLGEVCQLVDNFEDLPADLAAGRCYLPRADLRTLGLDVDDLRRGERPKALSELVRSQLDRWRGLLDEAAPLIGMVAPEYRLFLRAVLLGVQLQYDEVALRADRVFTDGVEPVAPASGPVRRAAWPYTGPVPDHVAVIMDGNRRWAAERGRSASWGHEAGGAAAMRAVNAALRLGVRHLTLYAFSTENWDRSQEELAAIFGTMTELAPQGVQWLHELGVRVRWCGRRDRINPSFASVLKLVESMTWNNDVLSLTVCIDYGGRNELADAARALAADAVAGRIRPEDIGPADLARRLYVPDLPDVDLLIRTSGEQRISNFLPWQLAYAEMVFDPTPWPRFDLERFREAIAAYAGRQRRFGGGLPHPAAPAEPSRTP